ncbi:MAG: S41 family peptidase [Synechococcaceae cyanobacterium]|nr:S41 family peptidase [Synechococcaceae cyanobacterium]
MLLLTAAAPAAALSDVQQLVVDAWRLVNQSYVDPGRLEEVHWRRLRQTTLEHPISSTDQAYDAIEAMLAPIGDPYTRMLRPEEFGTLRSSTEGRVCGVGLQLALRGDDQRIVVIAPLDGSPAAEAGISSGSELLTVNGMPTEELGLDGTAARLRGEAGSEVLVSLRDPDGRGRELSLRRRQVDLQPVRWRRLRHRGHDLALLRITQFSEPVPAAVVAALEQLSEGRDAAGTKREATGAPPEGVILDLRNNSGGLVSAGLAVADGFLAGDVIVETEDRDGLAERRQANSAVVYDGPLLTLVNAGTASASEILAGALQDDGRSRLAGSRTFGKGLIQTLIPLGDGSGLAVTVARYLTPSGRDIQNQGIQPDLPLSEPEPLEPGGPDDSWLLQAAGLLVDQLEADATAAAGMATR